MCDCFHLAFPNWHAESSGMGRRQLQGPEDTKEDDSISDSACDETPRFTQSQRPRPQGSSPIEEFPRTEKYTESNKEFEGESDPQHKTASEKNTKKSGLGYMFEKRSTRKMSKMKEPSSPESEVIEKTAKDGCAEGLVYGGGGKDGIFIKGVVPESPASKSLKLKEGDQVLSATVYFDNVSYEDAIQILEHAQAYKMKLCLKRKPNIAQTDAPSQSDMIPEDNIYDPEMREQGKTVRRGDARISWPKFPSFVKGRNAHFKRSHSSSDADDQRKLELSPTTSDTESPIKSQDALKGKKKNKMKLSSLTKRSRISSSEAQDAIIIGVSDDVQQTQESDMLSPECLEIPSGDTPEVCMSKDAKAMENSRPEQNNETLTEGKTPQHQTSVKTIEGKKKKKEKSELKMKIFGKDKSLRKMKSSPQRLKTLGASLDVSDHNDTKQSDITPIESTQTDHKKPKVVASDVDIQEKIQKSIQKQETKPGEINRMLQVGVGHTTNNDSLQQISVNDEEYKPKTELFTATVAEVKDDSYNKLLKERISRTQLPKREDIEIPGMEDKSANTKVKTMNESKTHREETVQMSIDVDSVKEAVSKLPGYKLLKVDTSGVPIPEEITVIDANAQRISVKTPTKVVEAKAKHDAQFMNFDAAASQDSSKTPIKLPKMTATNLASQQLSFETRPDAKKPPKQSKEIKNGAYKREDTIIPGREIVQSFDQTSYEIKGEKTIYLQDINISKTKIVTDKGLTGKFESDVKIPEIDGIEFIDSVEGSPAKKDVSPGLSSYIVNVDEQLNVDASIREIIDEDTDIKPEEHTGQVLKYEELTPHISLDMPGGEIDIGRSKVKSFDGEGKKSKFKMPTIGISFSKVKEPKTDLSPSKKDAFLTLPEAKFELKGPQEINVSVGSIPKEAELDVRPSQIKGEVEEGKFKMTKFGSKAPKFESSMLDMNVSTTNDQVTVQDTEETVKLPKAPEVDITLGKVDVSVPKHKTKVEKTEIETKALKTEGDFHSEGTHLKLLELGITMPKVKAPEVELNSSKKGTDVPLTEGKGNILAPDGELMAKEEITGLEIKVAEKDAKGSPFKFKMSSFKFPKFEVGVPNFSAEKCDVKERADIDIPGEGIEVNVTSASSDVVCSSIDIKENELEGKGSKFKIPSLGVAKPKVKGSKVEFSLSKKEVDIALAKTDQVEEDIVLPDVKVKRPDVEVKSTEINMEFKMPDFEAENDGHEGKFKKQKLNMKQAEAEGPEFDLSPLKGEVDVKIPETQVDPRKVNASPQDSLTELKKPELEIQPLEIEGQQGDKFKMPKVDIKMQINEGQETVAEVNTDVKFKAPSAKIEIKASQNEVTTDNIVGSTSQSMMPNMSFSLSEAKEPDELDGPFRLPKKGTNVQLPEGKAMVKLPKAPEIDVKLERVESSHPDAIMKLEKPELDVEMMAFESEGKESKFKFPKFETLIPTVQGPKIDFNLSKRDVKQPEGKVDAKLPKAHGVDINFGKVDVSIPEKKLEIKQHELEIKPLEVDCELEGRKFKVPKFEIKIPEIKGPNFDVRMSKKEVKLPEAEVKLPEAPETDVRLQRADISLFEARTKFEKTELEIKPLGTGAELQGQETKLKMPKSSIPMPEAKGPDVEVTVPEVKSVIKLSDVEVKKPSSVVEIKAPEFRVGSKNTRESPLKFKIPNLKLPKFDVGAQGVSAEDPAVDKGIEGEVPYIKIPEMDLTVNIEAPKIDANVPSLDIKMTETKHEGKSDKFEVPGLLLKRSDDDIDFKKADVTLPEVKVEVKFPDVEVKNTLSEVQVKSPEIKMNTKEKKGSPYKFKMPSFKMPKLGFGTPSVSAEAPAIDVKILEEGLSIKTEAPSIEEQGSTIDKKIEEPDLERQGVTLKVQSLPIKGPDTDVSKKIPGVKTEVEVPGIGVNVKAPNAEGMGGKLKMSDLGITQQKMKGSHINVEKNYMTFQPPNAEGDLPGVEIKGSSTKMEGSQFNLLTITSSKPGTSENVEGPTLKMPIEKTAADVGEQNLDREVPSLDIKMMEIESEQKQSKFKVQKIGISLPKVQKPKIDINLSKRQMKQPAGNVDVNLPNAPKVDIDFGEVVSLPETKLDIKKPELEIKHLEVQGQPEGTKFKVPKFGMKIPEIKSPKFDVSMPKKEVKLPETEVMLPEGPDINLRLESVDVSPTDAKMILEKAELDGQKIKFKMPKLDVITPNMKGSDDLNFPNKETQVAIPEAEATLPAVDLASTTIEIKEADTEVQLGGLKGSPSKFKLSTFKFPKFGITTPNTSAERPFVNQKIKTDGADMHTTVPQTVVSVPEVNLENNLPEVDVNPGGILIDPYGYGVDSNQKKTKFSLPRLSFSKPSNKFPEGDINSQNSKSIIPEGKVDLKTAECEAEQDRPRSKLKIPKFGIAVPREFKKDVDVYLKNKAMDVTLPEVEAEVELKNVSTEVDVKDTNIKIDTCGSPYKFKIPVLKIPKFGGDSLNISAEVPDLDLKIDEANNEIPEEVLTVNIEAPCTEAKTFTTDIKTRRNQSKGKGIKLEMSGLGFEGPEIDFSASKDINVTRPKVQTEAELPDVDVKKPSAEVEIQGPGIGLKTTDIEGSPAKFILPSFKFPKFGIATPDVNMDVPNMDKDIDVQGSDLKIKGAKLPDVEDKEPAGPVSIPLAGQVDADAKSRKTSWIMPMFSISKPSVKAPAADVSLQKVEVSLQEGTVEVTKHNIDLKQLEGDVQLDGQKSKFKFPSLGFKRPEINLSASKKDVDVKLPELKTEDKPADSEVKRPDEVEMKSTALNLETKDTEKSPSKFTMPKFKMPKFGVGSPGVSMHIPDVDKDAKLEGADCKIREEILTVNIDGLNSKSKDLTFDINMTESQPEKRGSKFNIPSLGFKGFEIDLSASKKDSDVNLPEVKADMELPDIEEKKPSADVEMKSPEVNLKTKNTDGSPFKFKNWLKLGVGNPQCSVEGPDIDKDIKLNGANLKTTSPKVDVKLTDVEAKEPTESISTLQLQEADADVKPRNSGWTMSRFSFSKPSVKAPETEINLKVPKPDVSIPEGMVEVKKPETDVQFDGQKSKFKFPSLGFEGRKINVSDSKKNTEVKLPEMKPEVKLSDVEVKKPSAEVEIKSPDTRLETKRTEESPSKFKIPTFKMPRLGVGGLSVSVDIPDVDTGAKLDGADSKIPEDAQTVKTDAPNNRTRDPTFDINMTESQPEKRGSKFNIPSLGFKGLEIDLSASKKDSDVNLPEVKADMELPDIEEKKPSAEVEIKSPEVNLKTKNTDGSPFKFKNWLKLGVGNPQCSVEGPDIDKDIKLNKADLKTTSPKVDVKLPDVEAKEPTGSISILQLQEADADVKPRNSGWTMSRFSFSKPNVKAPETEINLKVPKPDVSIPEGMVEVKKPETDVQFDGQKSKFKFPSLGFEGPEINLSDSKKNAEVKLPEMKPEVKLPDVEVKKSSAEVDVKSPDTRLETKRTEESPSKFKMPKFKMPRLGIGSPSLSIDIPNVDKDAKLEGADSKVLDEVLMLEAVAPRVERKGLSIDIETKESEQESNGSKLKFPSLGFKVEKAKKEVDVTLPEVKPQVQLPDVKLQRPLNKVKVTAPGSDVQAHENMSLDVKGQDGEAERSGGKFKCESFGISVHTIKGTETDVRLSMKDVTQPEVISDVQIPDIDVNNVEAADSEARAKKTSWTFPKLSFSKSSGKVANRDFKIKTSEVDVAASEDKAEACLPDGEVNELAMKVEVQHPDIKIEPEEIGLEQLKVSQKDVEVPLAEVNLSEKEVKYSETKEKGVGGSPLKFTIPTMIVPKFGGATQDSSMKTPSAEQVAQTEGFKPQQDIKLNLKGPNVDNKTHISKAATSGSDIQKANMGPESLIKFKLPSFKLPRLSFSRTISEEENLPAKPEQTEHEEEVKALTNEMRKSPNLSALGSILKTVDVEFDIPNPENVDSKQETTKEVEKHDEAPGLQVDQELTKSPERTGRYSFRFGLSAPSETQKMSEKDLQKYEWCPVGEMANEVMSPSYSIQSSDAFADNSSTITSELIGPLISSPTKITVKYSNPDSAVGPVEVQRNIITSLARSELIPDIPNLPEKITIQSSSVASSLEDNLHLKSGEMHFFKSNIQATPESQHAKTLTAVQVQPAASTLLTYDNEDASSWSIQDTQDSMKNVLERHVVKEMSSERRESTETVVITKEISHVFEFSEPISGEATSSIQRLRHTVHSKKMKFFNEAEN